MLEGGSRSVHLNCLCNFDFEILEYEDNQRLIICTA